MVQEMLSEIKELKEDNKEIKELNYNLSDQLEETKEELNETLEETNQNITELRQEQEDLINVIEETLIPNRNLPPNTQDLNHKFVLYELDNNSYYCLRRQIQYIKRKLKKISEDKIIINIDKYPNPIDFFNLMKEESTRKNILLKKEIVKKVKLDNPKLKRVDSMFKKIVETEFNKVKVFTIKLNTLYLNNSKIQDIVDYYNSLMTNKEEY